MKVKWGFGFHVHGAHPHNSSSRIAYEAYFFRKGVGLLPFWRIMTCWFSYICINIYQMVTRDVGRMCTHPLTGLDVEWYRVNVSKFILIYAGQYLIVLKILIYAENTYLCFRIEEFNFEIIFYHSEKSFSYRYIFLQNKIINNIFFIYFNWVIIRKTYLKKLLKI